MLNKSLGKQQMQIKMLVKSVIKLRTLIFLQIR